MVSEDHSLSEDEYKEVVLILVLVEDGLGVWLRARIRQRRSVLILVLVEDGLGVLHINKQVHINLVLILVLVEDGLGEMKKKNFVSPKTSLNPCFSGGWSRRQEKQVLKYLQEVSLNPCFSGGWSRRKSKNRRGRRISSLNPCFSGGWSRRFRFES